MSPATAPPPAAESHGKKIPIAEVAARLGSSREFAYDLVKRGLLPHYRFGTMIRVAEKDLEQFIAASKRGAAHTAQKAR
jgi:excisionase family DNA binding protein